MNHFEKVALAKFLTTGVKSVPPAVRRMQAGKIGPELHNPNRRAAGQVGNLFPKETPVATPKFNSSEMARLYRLLMRSGS